MDQKPNDNVTASRTDSGNTTDRLQPSLYVDDEPSAASGPEKQTGGTQKEIVEWIKALAIAALLVFVIRSFLFSPFIVDGQSMEPNFESGERVIVNKIIYDIRQPKRGEVVVFHVPDEGRDFIKRVIGVPGDQVRLEGDNLYINGKLVEETYLKEAIESARSRGELYNSQGGFPNHQVKDNVVPENTILAFGDNRSNSKDSRSIGYIPMDEVVGRADFIFWPIVQIKIVNHG